MNITLILMTLGATLLAAQLAALVLFRERAVVAHVTVPVLITLTALTGGLFLGGQEISLLDLAINAQWLQGVAALVGTTLLTGLSLVFLKPRHSRVTFMRALTIGLASVAAMLGAVRLWAAMLV
jgi:hypothetical protein